MAWDQVNEIGSAIVEADGRLSAATQHQIGALICRYTYDGLGRLILKETPVSQGQTGLQVKNIYPALDMCEPYGHVVAVEHPSGGNPPTPVNRVGHQGLLYERYDGVVRITHVRVLASLLAQRDGSAMFAS